MSDETIPEDVREAADTAWLELASLDRPGRSDEVPIIARAILAERERCARIVDPPRLMIGLWRRRLAALASRIRSSSHD